MLINKHYNTLEYDNHHIHLRNGVCIFIISLNRQFGHYDNNHIQR